jgi:Fe-S-cluster-containing dehydrogenase component
MAIYKFKLNKERCISCKACEVHCKVKNEVPRGISFNHIFIEPCIDKKTGKVTINNKYQPCYHCDKPMCMEACPEGAIYKREKDGIVLVDESKCRGHGDCIEACPWTVPAIHPQTGKMIKCDMCVDRIDEGLKPACVTGCTTHAIDLVKKEKKAKKKEAAGEQAG